MCRCSGDKNKKGCQLIDTFFKACYYMMIVCIPAAAIQSFKSPAPQKIVCTVYKYIAPLDES